MTELMAERHSAFHCLVAESDAIVAVHDWVFELLIFLGAPGEKVVLSRLALPETDVARAAITNAASRAQKVGHPVQLAFFGRLEKEKGPHVVIEALASMRNLPIKFDVYGAPQGKGGEDYVARLRRAASSDHRIRLLGPVSSREVVATMRGYDAVVVPSLSMETGPLVVPEALAAGVPVIGSALGGIPTFIRDGVDGMLVPPGDRAAWAGVLQRLVEDTRLLPTLTAGVRPPETMERVIGEMADLYSRLRAA
jgi:glycosyltransferase involved in cell wall biosynthesis